MSDIQRHAILLSLRSAFTREWFDLSGVSDACEVAGIQRYRQHPHWPTLNALHCKQWVDIGEHRMGVVRLVGEIFGWEQKVLTDGGIE